MNRDTLNILFVGDLNWYTRSAQRFRAFQELGHEVTPVSNEPDERTPSRWPGLPLVRALFSKLGIPLDLAGVNRKITPEAVRVRPNIIWIEKSLMIWPRVMKRLRSALPGTRFAFFSEDVMSLAHNQSLYFRGCLMHYDAVFTTKYQDMRDLPGMGAKRLFFVSKSYDPHTHRPLKLTEAERKQWGADVSFVGSFEECRAEVMHYLAENGVEVRVWGGRWERWRRSHPRMRIERMPAYSDDFTRVICASKINLNFLRKLNQDTFTSRTIEIPACEAFMLAERTEDHLKLFEEGKEAQYFGTKEELLEKIRYYLGNPQRREEIAKAARARCLGSGYSHHDRLRWMLERVLSEA